MTKQTCGTCKHTDNNLGFVALHCDLQVGKKLPDGDYDDGKMRSYEICAFKPSRWEKR